MSCVGDKRSAGGDGDDPNRKKKMPQRGSGLPIIWEIDNPKVLALMLLVRRGAGSVVKLKFNKARYEEGEDEWAAPYSALLPASEDKLTRWIDNLLNPLVIKNSNTADLKSSLNEMLEDFGRRNLQHLVFAAVQALAKQQWEEDDDEE